MKFGMRKPSLKRSLKARTTGKMKRAIKRKTNPFYGKNWDGTGPGCQKGSLQPDIQKSHFLDFGSVQKKKISQ